MNTREKSTEIEEEAIRWVWRLDREGRTPALVAALDAWCAADPRREGAFLQAEAAWTMLDAGRRLPGEAAPAPQVSRRRVFAAGAALAAGIAGIGVYTFSGERYGTTIGEIRSVPLADGSIAAINTQSRVDVDLKPDIRLVRINEGEAWFHVAKDSTRPFIVEAGNARVRAVGTAFSVRRRDNGAEVLVTEGTVETWSVGAEATPVRLSAGAKATITPKTDIAPKIAAASEIDRALAWRGGKIDLAGETLADAVGEFNRYNTRQLIIADPKLAQERFYGLFRTDDPEGFARAVRQSLGAKVSEDPSTIRLGG